MSLAKGMKRMPMSRYSVPNDGPAWTPAEDDMLLELALPYTNPRHAAITGFLAGLEQRFNRGHVPGGAAGPPLCYRRLWGLAHRLRTADYSGPHGPRCARIGPLGSIELLMLRWGLRGRTAELRAAKPDAAYYAKLFNRAADCPHLLRAINMLGPAKGRKGFGLGVRA